jgi:hypothetical protein
MELPFFAIATAFLARTAIMAWRRAQTSPPAAATRNPKLRLAWMDSRERRASTREPQ